MEEVKTDIGELIFQIVMGMFLAFLWVMITYFEFVRRYLLNDW